MILDKADDILVFGVLLSQLIRFSVSRWPYSGAGKPPMFGDYEAQRHWMEITVNLPHTQWYKNTSRNDLMYWGLDYPPLSAYQSLLFGYVSHWFDPEWVALRRSRGYESYEHKIFMRATVIIMDLLLFYIPTILYWWLSSRPAKPRDKGIATSLTLLYPGLILIDHGHFQYNCVSVGLTIGAVLCMMYKYDVLGSILYTLCLHYKQMSLYYSVPFFCYLLGSCFQLPWRESLVKFWKLSAAVVLTSVVCWLPFLYDYDVCSQVLSRLFPINRGLYEDKVANFWCSISVFVKLRSIFSFHALLQISALSTILVVLPSSIHLFRNPSVHTLRFALVNSSLAFFLFSYQVHEKSILFPAVAAMLLIEDHPLICCWFGYISTFSLLPLLAKENLMIPYVSLNVMFGTAFLRAYNGMGLSLKDSSSRLKTLLFILSLSSTAGLSIGMYAIKQPKGYPHLHILLNCIYSCLHFIGFAIYFHFLQFTDMPKTSSQPKDTKRKKKKIL